MSKLTSSAVIHKVDGINHLYMWGDNYHTQQGNGQSNTSAKNVVTFTEVKNLINKTNKYNDYLIH